MDTAPRDGLLASDRPSEQDVRLARRSSSKLSRLTEWTDLRITISAGADGTEVAVPEVAFPMLEVILDEMAQGHAVALSPVDQEVSTASSR